MLIRLIDIFRTERRFATGAEIWCAIIAAPAAYHMLALDRTPHLIEQDPADIGKTACYMLRWVNSRNEKGPWSDTVTAMIS